jgi:hypothetical protein
MMDIHTACEEAYKRGYERGGDAWNKYYLSEATPEAINSFEIKLTIKKAFRLMRETKKLSLEQAKSIISLLDTEAKQEMGVEL